MGWGHLEDGDDDDSDAWIHGFSFVGGICRLNYVDVTQVPNIIQSMPSVLRLIIKIHIFHSGMKINSVTEHTIKTLPYGVTFTIGCQTAML